MERWRARSHRRRNGANNPPDDWRARLGRKVSIRFHLRGEPSHPFSEAIGVVQAVAERNGIEYVDILNRRGDVTSVAVKDIVAAKLFPIDRAH